MLSRIGRWAALATLSSGTLAISVVPAANAAPATCPVYTSQTNYGIAGAYAVSTAGARARIEYNNPDLCGSDADGPGLSTAWTMITAGSAVGGAHGWAQSGYIQLGSAAQPFNTNGIHYFYQFTKACRVRGNCAAGDTGLTTKFFGTPQAGTAFYSDFLRISDHRIHMYAAGVDLGIVGYDTDGDWDHAWSAQNGVETFHKDDDVPGTSTDVTSFDYLQRYLADESTTFLSNTTTVNPTYSRHKMAATTPAGGGIGFNAWTDPL